MAEIYLTGALSDRDDPFAWHDELMNNDRWDDHTFVNPYTLNDFDLGDDSIYDRPDMIVEPALDAVESVDALLAHWQDDVFLVGSGMEILYAWLHDIPVVLWYDGYKENLNVWLEYIPRGRFESKERAVEVLIGFAEPDTFDFS